MVEERKHRIIVLPDQNWPKAANPGKNFLLLLVNFITLHDCIWLWVAKMLITNHNHKIE